MGRLYLGLYAYAGGRSGAGFSAERKGAEGMARYRNAVIGLRLRSGKNVVDKVRSVTSQGVDHRGGRNMLERVRVVLLKGHEARRRFASRYL